jgi:hypothetical protein
MLMGSACLSWFTTAVHASWLQPSVLGLGIAVAPSRMPSSAHSRPASSTVYISKPNNL